MHPLLADVSAAGGPGRGSHGILEDLMVTALLDAAYKAGFVRSSLGLQGYAPWVSTISASLSSLLVFCGVLAPAEGFRRL